MYTFNSKKQWINKDVGQQLPECEEGRKSGLGNRLKVGTEGLGHGRYLDGNILKAHPPCEASSGHTPVEDRDWGDHRWPGRDVHRQVMLPRKVH